MAGSSRKGRTKAAIPASRRARNPLITARGYALLRRMLEHPDAPAWNYVVGDRVERADLPAVEAVRRDTWESRERGTGAPPPRILEWVAAMRGRVPLFQEHIPDGMDPADEWGAVPTMRREDIAVRPEDIVPVDEPLDRLIVYDTSGATGHAIHVPHHPRAMAQNHPMMEFVLERFGVRPEFGADTVACVNVGAQVSTVVFANVFSVWKQAGFAKVNLHPRAWNEASAQRFFEDMAPQFVTGDPLGFVEMRKWGIDIRPAALLSTAVALGPALKSELEAAYGCPVIDTYATTETGPVAYANPEGGGLTVLPVDLYVEIVDEDGRPVAEGEPGEICVTGGRNPYMPLLRYRTGDFARMVWSEQVGSDPMPRLLDLQAREPVAFEAADGSVVSPVDIGRVIRTWVFVQHQFVQHEDRSCEMVIRPAPGCPVGVDRMRQDLEALFGKGIGISITLDDTLGDDQPGGKVIPFIREGGS